MSVEASPLPGCVLDIMLVFPSNILGGSIVGARLIRLQMT